MEVCLEVAEGQDPEKLDNFISIIKELKLEIHQKDEHIERLKRRSQAIEADMSEIEESLLKESEQKSITIDALKKQLQERPITLKTVTVPRDNFDKSTQTAFDSVMIDSSSQTILPSAVCMGTQVMIPSTSCRHTQTSVNSWVNTVSSQTQLETKSCSSQTSACFEVSELQISENRTKTPPHLNYNASYFVLEGMICNPTN